MEATLKVDYSELVAANTSAEKLEQTMRKISGGGGAGAGGGGGGQGGPAETAKSFRQWDTELRHVEHSGRGLLALFGVGGGILGAAMLVKHEIGEWYAMLDKAQHKSEDTGKAIAGIAAQRGPGYVQGQLVARRKEFEAMGATPEEAAQAIVDPSKMRALHRRAQERQWAPGGAGVLAGAQSKSEREFAAYYPTTRGDIAVANDADEIADSERQRAASYRRRGFEFEGDRLGRFRAWWMSQNDTFYQVSPAEQVSRPDGSASNPFHYRESGGPESGARL